MKCLSLSPQMQSSVSHAQPKGIQTGREITAFPKFWPSWPSRIPWGCHWPAWFCASLLSQLWFYWFLRSTEHWDTPIIKANNWALSYVLLISLLLGFLCPLLFIGRPSTATCILRQITFGALFTVAVATVLAKTLTVILAFKAMRPGRIMRRLLVTGASNYVIPICFLIQVVICGVWLGTSPPFLEIHTHSEPKNLILMCNKGTITAFYCILGYLGFLALRSFSFNRSPTAVWLVSWPGAYLTPSMNPSSLPSACWCSTVSGWPSSPSTTATRARLWWPWRSSPSWALMLDY